MLLPQGSFLQSPKGSGFVSLLHSYFQKQELHWFSSPYPQPQCNVQCLVGISQKFSSDYTYKIPKTQSAWFNKTSLDFEK